MRKMIVLSVCTLMMFAGCGKKVVKEDMVSELESLTSSPADETITDTVSNQNMDASKNVPATMELEPAAEVKTFEPSKIVTPEIAVISEKPTITNIQTALRNAGLYDGKIDGNLGAKTKKAIETFQSQNNLKVDGKVGVKTWGKLQTFLKAPTPSVTR